MTPDQAAWYLAAIIDGEGCVHFNAVTRRWCVQVTNSDTDILDAAERAMDAIGLPHSKRILIHDERDHRQQCWSVRLAGGRETYERLLAAVPLQCLKKLAKLRGIVDAYIDPPERPSREWLVEHYEQKQWVAKQIGAAWGGSTRDVYRWLEAVGVQRRGKREANALWRSKVAGSVTAAGLFDSTEALS